jgi:hypothetical protein
VTAVRPRLTPFLTGAFIPKVSYRVSRRDKRRVSVVQGPCQIRQNLLHSERVREVLDVRNQHVDREQ